MLFWGLPLWVKQRQSNKMTQNKAIPVSTLIIKAVHISVMLRNILGGRPFLLSKPLLIISEGCCSLPENVSGLKCKYVTVNGWLENDFGNWSGFLGFCCWKWFQRFWQAFALCESCFLESLPNFLVCELFILLQFTPLTPSSLSPPYSLFWMLFFFFCNLTSFPHIDALFLLYCMLFKCHYAIGCFESTVCVAPLHLDAVLVQNMHFTIMADLSPKSIFSSDRPRKRLTGHFTPVCLKQLSWVYQFMLAC